MNADKKPQTLDELCNFHEKQLLATEMADTHKYVLYGGSRGPGKSYWLRWYSLRFHMICASYGLKNTVSVLLCEDYPSLIDRQVSKIQIEFPSHLGVVADRKKSHGFAFYIHKKYGGGVILLRNLDEGNVEKYMSAEFALIAIDELTKSTVKVFDVLRGSMRWPGLAATKFIAATNPNGIGSHWVRNYWVDKVYPPELEDIKHEFGFVNALPTDNPHLDESYWEQLQHLPEHLVKAWLYGSWDCPEGAAFGEFYKHVHVLEASKFHIPSDWLRVCAIDWGYSAPTAVLWTAYDYEGTAYTYRELYTCKVGKTTEGLRINASEIARMILDMESGENIEYHVCDNACWSQTGVQNKRGEVSSIAAEFSDAGLDVIKCKKDRIQGKQQIHMRLKGYEESESGIPDNPAWYILDSCPNLIRILPSLELDKHDSEKVNTKGEDHLYDAAVYTFLEAPMSTPMAKLDYVRDGYEDKKRSNKSKRSWMSA